MPPTFTVYEPDGTNLGAIAPSSADWQHQAGEDGSGRLAGALEDIDAAQLAETTIVRVNDGTSDVFAFVPTSKNLRQNEASVDVDLSGPGVRWLLHAGQVLQEDTSDCAEPSSARWFGWMSGEYDDTSWDTPVSFGTFTSAPWETSRPTDWADPDAEYIWTSEGAFGFGASPPGDCYFRKTFTVTAEADYIVSAAGDDEYQLFIDGTEILSTIGGGALQWQRTQQRPISLCPGTHTIGILGRNLVRPVPGTNYGWVMASVQPANSSGEVVATNQRWAVYTDATSGTFTITTEGATTAGIAYNAAASAVQSALEALAPIDVGDVTVSGGGVNGNPWIIEFEGNLSAQSVPLTVDGSSLGGSPGWAIEADEYERGFAGSPVVRTDTTWKVLPYPTTVPGLTPGEVLRLAMEEAQGRGTTVLDHFSLGFTDSLDSDGAAWAGELTFPLSLPADIHRLAVVVEEMGYPIDVTPDLTLECWNDRGDDLTATVTLAENTAGVANVSATRDETAVANTIRYRAGDGWSETVDTTSVTARGRWEAGLNLDGFPTAADARLVVTPLLDDLATPPRSTTLDIPSEATVLPYDDFGMADVVTAPAFSETGFEAADMRVVSIAGRLEELSIVWSLELVD